jgi:hypothetical protein
MHQWTIKFIERSSGRSEYENNFEDYSYIVKF